MWARPGETWDALPALEKQRAVDAAAEDVVLEDASRRDRRQQLLMASDSHRGMFAGQESGNRPATLSYIFEPEPEPELEPEQESQSQSQPVRMRAPLEAPSAQSTTPRGPSPPDAESRARTPARRMPPALTALRATMNKARGSPSSVHI